MIIPNGNFGQTHITPGTSITPGGQIVGQPTPRPVTPPSRPIARPISVPKATMKPQIVTLPNGQKTVAQVPQDKTWLQRNWKWLAGGAAVVIIGGALLRRRR